MANEWLKAAALKNNVRLWELADALGIADTTLSRKLRKEFSDEKRAQAMKCIEEIARRKSEEV